MICMDIIDLNESCFSLFQSNMGRYESNKHVIILILHHRKGEGASNWVWASIWHFTVGWGIECYQFHCYWRRWHAHFFQMLSTPRPLIWSSPNFAQSLTEVENNKASSKMEMSFFFKLPIFLILGLGLYNHWLLRYPLRRCAVVQAGAQFSGYSTM